ncbi:MAG: hypothetical protein WC600_17275 [Desulfobaccales bacterium]
MADPLTIPKTSIHIQVADNGYYAEANGDAVKLCSQVFDQKADLFLWLAKNITFRGSVERLTLNLKDGMQVLQSG